MTDSQRNSANRVAMDDHDPAANEYLIERGVPLPPGASTGPTYPWDKMAVGDSFFVPGKKQENMSSVASSAAKRRGWKFATRTVPGGVRVWRVR